MTRRRRKKIPSEPIELSIHGLAHDGRGVGQTEAGKTVFVDMALPGERVAMKYTYSRSKFDEGRCIEVLEAANNRVAPDCDHFGICGGCSMQHLAHSEQIQHKQSILVELLKHQADVTDYKLLKPIQSQPWSYRRKARLGVKYVHKKQTALVGFREKRSAFIADISDCSVLDDRVSKLLLPLREMITTLDGRERIPQIEVACGDNKVALVFRHLDPLSAADEEKLTRFAKEQDFELYLQPGGPDSVTKIWPDDKNLRLDYELPDYDLTLGFHPMDFTQVNADINLKMLKQAMALLQPAEGERILDLFCGLGNFSLPIATSGAEVVAVEGDERMVHRGYENAKRNNLTNVSFHAADLTQDLTQMDWASAAFDKILIDPPRSGALEIVQDIHRFNANRIVYVSCNPITLARDTKVLLDSGYTLISAGVMDMFPHTAHVESIALFEKK
jgi:23S rRNA (uracil1939-C5)-methyltransferase